MSRIELSTFVGEWSDSLRNNVTVWDAGRGIQVSLTKADRSGKEILLAIKKNRSGTGFVCGHYDLDETESTESRIVWRDNRFSERITVWTRKGSEHRDRECRDPEHRDREHRDREHRDRGHRDQDHRDRDSADRDYQDRDYRDREYRDRDQQDRDSDGKHGHHREPDPQRPKDEGRKRRSLPRPPASLGALSPPPGDFIGSMDGAVGKDLKREGPQEASPAWQPVQQQQSPFDAKPAGAASPAPPWSSSFPPGPPAPVAAAGPPSSWSPAPWAPSPTTPASGGQSPLPTTSTQGSSPGPPALVPPRESANNAWPPQPLPADSYYSAPAGSGRSAASMVAAPSGTANDSDLTQVLSYLAATASQATTLQGSPGSHGSEASSVADKEKASRPWRRTTDTAVPGLGVVVPPPAVTHGAAPGVALGGLPGLAPGALPGAARGAHPTAFGVPPTVSSMGKFDPQSAGWNEVLDLLAAATSGSTAPRTAEVPAGQIDELFNPFGLPQAAPAEAPPSEEVREQVLVETLARLLREKTSEVTPAEITPGQSVAGPVGGVLSSASLQSQPDALEEDVADLPDWARKQTISPGKRAPMLPSSKAAPRVVAPLKSVQGIRIEQPLDQFIRVFRLDELAAKCLRALEDDEAAFVIEACQGRLKFAKNPSAVVMTSIKSVAARVGRRYWGNREQASDLESLLAAAGMGNSTARRQNSDTQLQMFEGDASPSPEADADGDGVEEYGEDEEEEEDEAAKDEPVEEVEATESDPYAAMLAFEAEADPYEAENGNEAADSEPNAKRRRTDGDAVVEVDDEADADVAEDPSGVIECLEAEASLEEEDEAEDVDDEDANLFFVDTGGR